MKSKWEKLIVVPAAVLYKCWVSLRNEFILLFKERIAVQLF